MYIVYIKEHNKEKIVKRKQKREEKKLFLQRYINKFPFETKKTKVRRKENGSKEKEKRSKERTNKRRNGITKLKNAQRKDEKEPKKLVETK